MPRKKTIQPLPLEEGENYEVRDEECWLIGRGMHKNFEFRKLMVNCLEKVADDYLTPSGPKEKPSSKSGDYMSSGHKFADEMIRKGLGGSDGEKHFSLRHRIYHEVKLHKKALENALAKKNLKD